MHALSLRAIRPKTWEWEGPDFAFNVRHTYMTRMEIERSLRRSNQSNLTTDEILY